MAKAKITLKAKQLVLADILDILGWPWVGSWEMVHLKPVPGCRYQEDCTLGFKAQAWAAML